MDSVYRPAQSIAIINRNAIVADTPVAASISLLVNVKHFPDVFFTQHIQSATIKKELQDAGHR